MPDQAPPKRPAGRILCLDVGEVRIGVALSDELGLIATPFTTIERQNRGEDVARIREIVEAEDVAAVVVGVPYQLDGTVDEQAERVINFARRLARRLPGIPVHHWDERLTTAQAERVLLEADLSRQRRRLVVDQLAATLILNSFLEASSDER